MQADNEQRIRKLDKKRRRYTGGSFSSQFKRMEVNQHYENEPIARSRAKVKIKIKGEGFTDSRTRKPV